MSAWLRCTFITVRLRQVLYQITLWLNSFFFLFPFYLDEIPAAIDTLDRLLTPPNPQKSLEAMIMLASLKAHPRQGVSNSTDNANARDLLERVVKEIQITTDGDDKQRTIRGLGDDMEMWIELARLWENENLEKTSRAYREALRIAKEKGVPENPKLLNNIAALKHLDGVPAEARSSYEVALTHAAKDSDELSTTILYNLGRCYEDLGEVVMAQEAYEKLLARHPEYVDGTSLFAFSKRYSNRHCLSQNTTSGNVTQSQSGQRGARPLKTGSDIPEREPQPPSVLHILPSPNPSIQTRQGLCIRNIPRSREVRRIHSLRNWFYYVLSSKRKSRSSAGSLESAETKFHASSRDV